ncbi:MAG: polyprenyl synthetase family protein [Myxococcaceae bacterium]
MTHIAGRLQDELGLAAFQLQLEQSLRAWLDAAELRVDELWEDSRAVLVDFALRPAKRVRPTLLATGYALARGSVNAEALVDFGAGLELLHAFMLVHDDVADRATTRRGGPALHVALGGDRAAESKAIVAGDYLYARALEAMLATPGALPATRYMLEVCRYTAAGQHLDLALASRPLGEVALRQAVRVAKLKTARYGFVAPLVCGAMLGGGSSDLVHRLSRVGERAGLAYQLRDDVIGLFGDDAVAGKQGGADFLEGKRTVPVLVAWQRADAAGRERLERLWAAPSEGLLSEARAEVVHHGGLEATERLITRATEAARVGLDGLPRSPGLPVLSGMLGALAARAA